jgi:hypothetical protein
MIRIHRAAIVHLLETTRPAAEFWLDEGVTTMKTKLGSTLLASLLYAQGLLGIAAVAVVLAKEPAKQHHHAATQSAAVEGIVSVR